MKRLKKLNLSLTEAQRHRGLTLLVSAALLLFWSGCATIPKDFPGVDEEDFGLLPSGGKVYVWANINEARPILEAISFDGMSLEDAGGVLDRTRTAVGVFNGEESAERFFLTLRGEYPTFQAGFSMTFSRGWKKQKSKTGNSYWFSPQNGIGLALGPALALVSGGDPFVLIPPAGMAIKSPDGFDDFREATVMAGWIPEPEEPVNKFLNSLAIPIQVPAEDFFFCIVPAGDDQWELEFRIRTSSANQARALLTLFTLARMFIVNSPISGQSEENQIAQFLPVLFANLPRREEAVLSLRTPVLDTRELSLLFEAFSVYSGQE